MSHPAQPKKVAISYAWNQETEGENNGAVDRLCENLTERGVPIRRDLKDLKHGDDIRSFMQSIGASDFLCVFLSDNYLRSPNCMYELLIAWERSRDNAAEFRSRVKVWRMPDMSLLSDIPYRMRWVTYWRQKYEEMKPYLENGVRGVSEDTIREIRLMEEFSLKVDAMLAFMANTLTPQSFEDFEKWIEELVPGTTKDTHDPEAVFGTVIEEIDLILERNATVSGFLFKAIPEKLARIDGKPSLRPAIRSSGFRVVDCLFAVGHRIKEFKGTASDFDDLQMALSGLIVLGVDASWVVRNRLAAGAEVPVKDVTVPMADDQTANLLPILVAALAGGLSQLSRVYADRAEENDPRRIKDIPVELSGVNPDERAAYIRNHISEAVLPSGWRQTSLASDEEAFAAARQIIRREAARARKPYFGTGPGYKEHQAIIREQIEIPSNEMILIFQDDNFTPSGSVFAERIDCLSELRDIFLIIEARRKQLP